MGDIGSIALRVLLLVLLDAVLVTGLFAIPLGLSGNFILLGAALAVSIATKFHAIGAVALLVMAAFVAAGEILEALLGSVMTRRYGGTRWGMIGAFVGGLAGAAAGTALAPIVGTIFGSFAGTAGGALAAEALRGGGRKETMRAGWGALVGKSLASALKLTIGIGIALFVVLRTHR